MTTEELASRLCGDLVRRVAEWDGQSFLVTNFRYPDGDFVNIFIDDRGVSVFDDVGAIGLSDRGITLFKCRENGIELTPPRARFIEQICAVYDTTYDKGVIRKTTSTENVGVDALAFCEAITRISALEYEKAPRYASPIPDRVDRLIDKKIAPLREVKRRWVDLTLDKGQSHPIDYRVNGEGLPCNIFVVTTDDKCTAVAAVSHFFQSRNIWIPTLSITDPRAGIGEVYLDRLAQASLVKHGVRGNEESIIKFALAGMPPRFHEDTIN